MKKNNIFSAIFAMCLVLVGCLGFTSCNDGGDLDTNQYKEGINLNVFGPSPVARGGELRFIGTNLDKVTSISIPGCSDITDIKVISSEEIHVTVPQTAQPGYVTLHTPQGDITTITLLTYTEPVGFAESGALSPNPVKPGTTLTIKGEYLNLVTGFQFAEKVLVEKADFLSQSREQITLTVPFEAQTGKVSLVFCATGDTIPNEILSEEELEVILPSVAEVKDIEGAKPGDVITISGSNLDLVAKVLMPNGKEVEFEAVDEAVSAIKFTLPDDISTGYIRVVPASGVEVVVANNGVAEPTDLKVEPATGIRANDILVITGKNLDIVTSVNFPGVEEAVALEEGSTAESISVKMPESATSGELMLNTGYGVQFPIAIETLKPVFESFVASKLNLGNDVEINGQNFDLIKTITYTGGAVAEIIDQTATYLKISMPTSNAETGVLTFTMANGETVETGELTIDAPLFCYVVEWPQLEEDELIQAGSVMTVKIENGDHLQKVLVNGEEVQYILNNGTTLYINTPYNAKQGSVITLVSDNGSIEYPYDFKPNTEIETVVWQGMEDLGSWSNQPYLLSDAGGELKDAGVKVGYGIRFYVTPTDEKDWRIEMYEGHWTKPDGVNPVKYGNYSADGAEGGIQYDLKANKGYIEIEATEELLNYAFTKGWWGGVFVCQGQHCIITKITVVEYISLETTLWEGSEDMGNFSNQPYILADAGGDLKDAGAKVGQTIYFYLTKTTDDWRFDCFEGHWTKPDGVNPVRYGSWSPDGAEGGTPWDLDANKGKVSIKVTQELLDYAYTQGWWGGVFVVQGKNCVLTKITIE